MIPPTSPHKEKNAGGTPPQKAICLFQKSGYAMNSQNNELPWSDFVKRLKPMSATRLDAFGSGNACAQQENRISSQGIGAVM